MNDVAVPDNFQTRLERKIQESIGELMTPDDVKRLVEAGINKTLFQPREVPNPNYTGYGERLMRRPSLVDELVNTHFSPLMKGAVTEWLQAHPEVFLTAIEKALDDFGQAMVTKSIAAFFAMPINTALESLKQDLRNKGILVN